jgi:hypothetical protein
MSGEGEPIGIPTRIVLRIYLPVIFNYLQRFISPWAVRFINFVAGLFPQTIRFREAVHGRFRAAFLVGRARVALDFGKGFMTRDGLNLVGGASELRHMPRCGFAQSVRR